MFGNLFLIVLFLELSLAQIQRAPLPTRVIIAVNAGGPAHRDIYGINYAADKLEEGERSDYGMRYDIERAPLDDGILYQTERYTLDDSFEYEIPLRKDGSYVLVLKFSEVYFKSAGQKVFNVALDDFTILSHLDIYREVGLATAHDEVIPFIVKNNAKKLKIHDSEVPIRNGKVNLRFLRGLADNPKINAFYVVQGTIYEIPKLPPLMPPQHIRRQQQQIQSREEFEEEDVVFEDEDNEEINLYGSNVGSDMDDKNLKMFSSENSKRVRRSGPVQHVDPWELKSQQDKWFPIVITVISFLVACIVLYISIGMKNKNVQKTK
ncbi:malectin [Folsomia candida]|uniref:Malectin n=1 Tax=Folsomia candida TaxID=158441 RepID=A0A226EGE7_FOLCA|nr:malectin [Folsomia candida]XP_035706590.1 malectin [Folsomia candida]OXA55851.1 Malectin [Folsomia candida]